MKERAGTWSERKLVGYKYALKNQVRMCYDDVAGTNGGNIL